MMNLTNKLRCAECRYEDNGMNFLMHNKRCPRCGSSFQFDPDNDLILVGHSRSEEDQGGVWIRLNWAELRVLAIWSRFWADQKNQEDTNQWGWMLRTVDAIANQIKRAAPIWPLTVADDAAIVKKANPDKDVTGRRPDGTEVQLEPTWLNTEITREEPPAPKEK